MNHSTGYPFFIIFLIMAVPVVAGFLYSTAAMHKGCPAL